MSTTVEEGALVRLQDDFTAFLQSDLPSGARAFFTDATPAIPILTEEKGSLQDAINAGVRRTGMSVLVKAFTADGGQNQVAGKVGWDKVYLACLVGYTPKLPGGIHGATIAEKIVWVAQHFRFEGKYAPKAEGIDTVPDRKEFPDQSFLAVSFTFRELFTAKEPVRGEPGVDDDETAPFTLTDDVP